MLGIVPIFSSVAVLSGNTHAAGTSALILAAAEIISTLCAFAVVPIMSAYTAISIASGVSPIVGGDLSSSLKTAANFIMGFICTAFLGLVSVQSSIGAAADSFKMKTARFLVGSLVPATGTALSEAVTTVSGSMALLKSSVGIYAVFGVAAVILPVLAELAAWRISLNLSAAAAAAFSVKSVGKVFGSIDSALSLLMGITVFTGAIFIISMGIVVSVKC